MVPLRIFASQQFSGANLTTFAVYAALSVTTFLLILHLQQDLHYSALAAGHGVPPGRAAAHRASRRVRARSRSASGRGCR